MITKEDREAVDDLLDALQWGVPMQERMVMGDAFAAHRKAVLAKLREPIAALLAARHVDKMGWNLTQLESAADDLESAIAVLEQKP